MEVPELDSSCEEGRVREDFLGEVRNGVNFFINGVRYDDSWDLETVGNTIKNDTRKC